MVERHEFTDGNTEEWLALRNSMEDRIGGSELGCIAGHVQYCSPFTFFCRKTGAIPTPDISGREAIIQGHDFEPYVAERFEREMGKKVRVENCIFTNTEFPHLKASIDRAIEDEDSGLECKTASQLVMRKYKNGDFPMSYFDQCLLYLAVTEKKRWYLAMLVFQTAFRMFLMTRVKEEADRFEELKKRFRDEPIDAETAKSADYREWLEKWAKLEAVYYVDEEEIKVTEVIASKFIERVEAVKAAMAENAESYKSDDERQAALICAVRQVWPTDEIDGSEDTANTVSELNPTALVHSVVTMDEGSKVLEMVKERAEIDQAIKDLIEEKNKVESRIEMELGIVETCKMPGWKVTFKNGSPRETASASAVREYFASKGMNVPNGLIKTSEPSRSLRFYAVKDDEPKKKGKKK